MLFHEGGQESSNISDDRNPSLDRGSTGRWAAALRVVRLFAPSPGATLSA